MNKTGNKKGNRLKIKGFLHTVRSCLAQHTEEEN